MSNEKIYTDLNDKNGNKLYVGDKVRFTVKPYGWSYDGVIILADGGIFIEYDFMCSPGFELERHPLYLVDDEDHDMNATIPIHYVYEKIDNV